MNKRTKVLAVVGITSLLLLGGGGLAYAGGAIGGEGKETTVTGADADRAGKAATDSLGGGEVVRVVQETDSDTVVFEVDVKKADGSTASVEITKDFTVAPPEPESGTEGSEGNEKGD